MNRMRTFVAVFLMSSSATAVVAQNSNDGFYFGGGAGGAKYNGFNQLCRDITGSLPGIDVDTDCDSSETSFAWKIFGGWRWNRYVSLEAGFANLGEAKGDTLIFGQDVNGEISSTALFAELVGSIPLGTKIRLFGKLGVANISAELNTDLFAVPLGGLAPTSLSEDSTEAVYGTGLEFGFTQNLMGRMEWERFDFEDGIDLLSASLVYYPGK